MISHSTKTRSSRTRHMNAAAPQFGATGLVHLRDKDILSSVSRKFSGLPDEAARWFREFSTFMDKHDLGPYKDNTVSVLVNDFHVVSDPQMQPDVPHTDWIGPTGPLPFSSDRTTTSAMLCRVNITMCFISCFQCLRTGLFMWCFIFRPEGTVDFVCTYLIPCGGLGSVH